MKLLLDTHVYLWLSSGTGKIPAKTLRRVADARNERYLSIASVWELAIKISLGKLQLPMPLGEHLARGLDDGQIGLLPIAYQHVLSVATLPRHHGDPFDRLLVAQAEREGMSLVSADAAFDTYALRRLW